jgi:hypothetical protein
MIQNITESTLIDALKHFEIKAIPKVWNGHFEFKECIIKVQKTSAIVYMSGRSDNSKVAKVRATIDHSKGVGGQILKYLEIYPVIKDANTEPVKLDEDKKKTNEYTFILPEIKTIHEAREFIKKNGGDGRGLANIGEEMAKERILTILESNKMQAEQPAQPLPHPADEIDKEIVQDELKSGDIIKGNEEQPVDL